LSMGGYDSGYIYEYQIDQKSEVPYFFKMVDDADDIEISSYVYKLRPRGEFFTETCKSLVSVTIKSI
jgi:hypothetical protein